MSNESVTPTYRELRQELIEAGCFETAPVYSVLALFANLGASATFFLLSGRTGSFLLSIPLFILGSFFFYRLGWLMHDSAHGGTFKSAKANHVFASITAGILGEFPSGWRYGHNKHHASTNVRGMDFDQRERWDPTRRYRSRLGAWFGLFSFTRIGKIYYPSSLLFMGIRDAFYCYYNRRDRFRVELFGALAGIALQLLFFSYFLSPHYGVLLLLVNMHFGILYLNPAFAGNHYDLPNYTPDEARVFSFEELQARTTRNYSGGAGTHFVFGGLEKQLEHHLFPSLPRHQLKKAAPIVRSFCERRGLPYNEESFLSSFAKVLDFHVIGKA